MNKFNKVIRFFMNQSFFTKMFASFLISSVIGALSITAVYHIYFKKVLIESETERVQQSVNQSVIHLENILSQVSNDMDYFISFYESGIKNISSNQETEININSLKNELETFQLRFDNELETVFYYKENKVTQEPIFIYTDNYSRIKEIDYTVQNWYKSYLEHREHISWTEPSEQHLFYQDRSITSLWLTIGRYNEENEFGLFVVRLNADIFKNAFKELTNEDLVVNITDSNNNLIYSSELNNTVDKSSWINLSTNLENMNFDVNVYINQEIIVSKVNKILSIVLIVALMILAVIFLISLGLSLTLSKPIQKMILLLKEVEGGNFNVYFPVKYNDEVGRLGEGFNIMATKVSNLIRENYVIRMDKMKSEIKQQESTIKVLQNQINPHFLYNTLEVINCLAIVNEVQSISKMSAALGEFYRYSIKDENINVSLKEEIHHVEMYLKILQERYPEIDISIDIPESFTRYPIIKLTIQPLIENAFKHAFIGDRPYYLSISVQDINQDDYYICVEDNGEGMEEQDLKKINDLCNIITDNINSNEGYFYEENEEINGIGILNVHIRLSLHFGYPYGISMEESETGGLKIYIRLPKRRK